MKINHNRNRALDHSRLKVRCILDIKTLEFLLSSCHMTLDAVSNAYGWVMWMVCFPK